MDHPLRTKRVYEPAAPEDGTRVLVDRIWPRGLSREAAALDLWLKEVAPTTALRKWFGHAPERWEEFRRRYEAELAHRQDALEALAGLMRKGAVTLLYAAHDAERNNAEALRRHLVAHRGRDA
jgi:uncharacterized protein YeaO (DUF488 family)